MPFLPFANHVQHKRLAFAEPVADVAAMLDGHAHHRRLEARLHHPARKHPGCRDPVPIVRMKTPLGICPSAGSNVCDLLIA